jgi:hypothetical protein
VLQLRASAAFDTDDCIRGGLAALAAAGVLAACLGLVTLASRRAAAPTVLMSLWYKDGRGLTYSERSAIKKSKQLATNVRLEEQRNPSLVQRFMKAYRSANLAMTEEYDYQFKPWAVEHGLKGSHTSQLKVIMTECVKCVSECPAYVKNPIKAGSFEEFSHVAQKECGMCYEGVEGPCPANADNHGVLRVADKHDTTTLFKSDKGPNPVQGTYAQSPYTKATYPRSMGTNQVFLGKAYKAGFAKQSATLKVASKGVTSLHTDPGPNPVQGTYTQSPYTMATYPRSMGTNQAFLGHANKAPKQQLYQESFEQAEKAQAMYDQPHNSFLHEDSAGSLSFSHPPHSPCRFSVIVMSLPGRSLYCLSGFAGTSTSRTLATT